MANKKITDLPSVSTLAGTEPMEAVQGGTNVQVTPNLIAAFVQDSLGLVNHWRGAWDASGNAFPSTGGNGPGGAPEAGDEWYISVGGAPNGFPLNPLARITALIQSPGQTQANWLITNN